MVVQSQILGRILPNSITHSARLGHKGDCLVEQDHFDLEPHSSAKKSQKAPVNWLKKDLYDGRRIVDPGYAMPSSLRSPASATLLPCFNFSLRGPNLGIEPVLTKLKIVGLNIIQDDLSPTSGETSSMHPELEAQLQMWTNLEFPTDDAPFFNPERDTASRSRHKAINPDAVSDPLGNSLSFFGNVGAALSSSGAHHQDHREKSKGPAHAHSINDLFSWEMYNGGDGLLHPAGIAVDPFLSASNIDSLSHDSSPYAPTLATDGHHPLTIRGASERTTKVLTLQTIDPSTTSLAPAAKRQKLRKPSSSVDLHSSFDFQISELDTSNNGGGHGRTQSLSVDMDAMDGMDGMDGMDDLQSPTTGKAEGSGSNVSAAEDKRRRNTLASARFRLKKKEREAAMEKKAKELDDKVTELERECESLRKENQWLKGLVVGATNGESVMGSNPPSVTASPANGLVHPTPANGLTGAVTNAEAARGSVIDIDELIRVLRANGAVVTGAAVAQAAQAQQAAAAATAPPPVPASTGKRKRGSAN